MVAYKDIGLLVQPQRVSVVKSTKRCLTFRLGKFHSTGHIAAKVESPMAYTEQVEWPIQETSNRGLG